MPKSKSKGLYISLGSSRGKEIVCKAVSSTTDFFNSFHHPTATKPSETTIHTGSLIPQTHSNQPPSQTTSFKGEILAKTRRVAHSTTINSTTYGNTHGRTPAPATSCLQCHHFHVETSQYTVPVIRFSLKTCALNNDYKNLKFSEINNTSNSCNKPG